MLSGLKRLVPSRLKRALHELRLRGTAVHCSVCDRNARLFLPSGTPPRPQAMCPFCGSLERTRMMALALKARELPEEGHRVLHVAPDRALRDRLRHMPGVTYVAGDKHEPGYSYPPGTMELDITAIPFPDDHFHLIICSHVLEHVQDDRRAMRELFRVLRPGGVAILLVPLDGTRAISHEDPTITDPNERLRVFGQFDHVRIYGRDYYDRLREAGFDVTLEDPTAGLCEDEIFRLGLLRRERLVVGGKDLRPAST